jgi:guanylate kinase
MNKQTDGKLIIISGPSGAGKSTVVRELLSQCDLPLTTSVSVTTRKPRDSEQNGIDYFFVDEAKFLELRSAAAFLECKQNFGLQHWYGTLHDQVAAGLNAGKWVILEIDVLGAMEVIEDGRFDPITIFIHPGGMDELEKRLRLRGSETEESLTARLETAAAEMRYMSRYTYEVINQSVSAAVAEICEILKHHSQNHVEPHIAN